MRVCEFFIPKSFFLRERFLYDSSTFFKPIRKCSVTYYCNWIYMAKDLMFSGALGPETEEKIKYKWLVTFKRWIGRCVFNSREKFDNSFYFEILGKRDSQLYKDSLDLGFRFLQLKPDALHHSLRTRNTRESISERPNVTTPVSSRVFRREIGHEEEFQNDFKYLLSCSDGKLETRRKLIDIFC